MNKMVVGTVAEEHFVLRYQHLLSCSQLLLCNNGPSAVQSSRFTRVVRNLDFHLKAPNMQILVANSKSNTVRTKQISLWLPSVQFLL